ncbi:MAG: DUF998 domain-containing protein [Azonexus sp.]|nr:DUF998 domain-containing protein [Azonexus sp.]
MARRVIRAGLFCGILAPLLWAAMIVAVGELRPGFDHVGQYISELAERGSANAGLMRYGGFVASGLLHIAYAAAFYAALRGRTERRRLILLVAVLIALNGLGRIGAGLFACAPGCAAPEDPVQRLHSQAATVAFLAIAAAALFGSMLFRSARGMQALGLYSLATGIAGLLFLGLMSAGEVARVGLYERLASGILSLWVLVTALRLATRGNEPDT